MRVPIVLVACSAGAMLVSGSATAGDLAFDHSGNLFLAASDNTILKLAPDGSKTTFADSVEGASALAFDAADNLFVGVADAIGTIYKLSPDGTKSMFASGVGLPFSLAFDPAGNLFVYDMESGSILKFSPNRDKSTFKPGKKPPEQMFANSMKVACDRKGNVFAADQDSDTIFKFAPDGTRSTFATKVKATDLAVDPNGNLLTANFWSKTILKFAPDGTRTKLKTNLNAPEGLAVDANGNLFVYDNPDRKIVKVTPDGSTSTFAENKPEPAPTEPPRSDEEREAAGEDSSRGLPQGYAKNYLIARSTFSRDKKFVVIYPNAAMEDAAGDSHIKDYLVTLQPFSVLKALDTKWPYFEHESHGGLSAEWSNDTSVGLITLDSKWGPQDVFLVEFNDGKLSRITNILRKAHDLLVPAWRKAKAERYNDYFEFVFMEDASFNLAGTNHVVINAEVDTTPNDLGLSPRAWHGRVEAVWDIPQAKFTAQKVSGERRKKTKETREQ